MYKKTVGFRLLAFIIDSFFIGIIAMILYALFGFGTLETSGFSFNYSMNWVETTTIYMSYFAVTEYIMYGQSLGKKLLGIEVTGMNLYPLDSRNQYFVRGLLKGLFIMLSIISFLMVVFSKNRQSIHDLIMKTLVIRKVENNEYIQKDL